MCLEILLKMVYARNEEQYSKLIMSLRILRRELSNTLRATGIAWLMV